MLVHLNLTKHSGDMTFFRLLLLVAFSIFSCAASAYADGVNSLSAASPQPILDRAVSGNDSNRSSDGIKEEPILLRPPVLKSVINRPLTLYAAVQYAQQNYPTITRGQAQVKAAQETVHVQKLSEYLPDSLFQFQELMASHNKLSQVIFGSPVFPAQTGPGFPNVNMQPQFYSGAGVSLDWAPIDFGLHKARINLTKEQSKLAQAQFAATKLDVAIAAANAFLDVVEAAEQVRAIQENVNSFKQFSTIVNAQVRADLKPGGDASLADAQLANAENQLLRGQLNKELAAANLANALGVGGQEIDVEYHGIITSEQPAQFQRNAPVFSDVPILQATQATIFTAQAQKKILQKSYFPVLHFLGGMSVRGAGLNNEGRPTGKDVDGLAPIVPNYQIAMILNWNFLDTIRLRAEKRVQDQRILQQQAEYNLVLQNLKTEDVRSRARVRTAVALANNMPIQVRGASEAARQAEARYKVGLSSVAQVAEANQVLAQSRMQEAVARVGVWRALLSVASVHGDLHPFLAEAEHAQRGY